MKDCSPQPVLDSLSPVEGQLGKFLPTLTLEIFRSVSLCSIPDTSSLETTPSESHLQLPQPPLAWTTYTAPLVLPHKSIPIRTSFIAATLHTLLNLSIYFFFFLSRRCSQDREWKNTVGKKKKKFCCNFILSSSCLEGHWFALC